MIRSLFSGVTGMKNHQTYMDVVGDNVTNINTVGFKRAQASFQDTLSGLMTNMDSGGLKTTGRTLDLAINGNGFFKVINPADGKEYYTREGTFYIDQSGYIVNSSGYRLVGELRNIVAKKTQQANDFVTIEDLKDFQTSPVVIIKDFTLFTAADTPNSEETLILQGTTDEGVGKASSITIKTAQRAVQNSRAQFYLAPGANTPLSDIATGVNDRLENGDVIEFTVTNNRTGETASYEFQVINANTQTVADLQKYIADETDNKLEMYFTQGGQEVAANDLDPSLKTGIHVRTTDYGKEINLKITTKDYSGEEGPRFTLNTAEDGISGDGDVISNGKDGIVERINSYQDETGIKASYDEKEGLKLETIGKGENAIIRFSGSAAKLLGFPVSTYLDIPASACQKGNTTESNYARIYAPDSDVDSYPLILQGTLSDGTPGTTHEFMIEPAQRAVVNLDKRYNIKAGGLTSLQELGFQDGDKLQFVYRNGYDDTNKRFEITITDSSNKNLSDLKTLFENEISRAGLAGKLEMYFTKNGVEVQPNFLNNEGIEGFAFRTTDYGPKVSLQVQTLNENGKPYGDDSNLPNDLIPKTPDSDELGDDLDSIIEKINKESQNTGVVAKKVNDRLVLETLGAGENATLNINGEAAYLLNMGVTPTNNTAATTSGTEQYARVTEAETSNSSAVLILQGTKTDGSQGKPYPIEIETAKAARILAGDNYSITDETTLANLNPAFQSGSEIIVEYRNNYNGKSGNFIVPIDGTETLEMLNNKFIAQAIDAGLYNEVEMYYTANGDGEDIIEFRTLDYGPQVSLTVSTKDKNGEYAQIFNNIDGSVTQLGTGDDIDNIVTRINELTLETGVIATKNPDNTLRLETMGSGRNAELKVSGDAAALIGLPVSTDANAVAAGTESYARITPDETSNNSEILSLRGALADGTPGEYKEITIEKATAAEISAGDFTATSDLSSIKLNTWNFSGSGKIIFTIHDKYDPANGDKKIEVPVNNSTTYTIEDLIDDLQSEDNVDIYFIDENGEKIMASDIDDPSDVGSNIQSFGFITKNSGPGVSLTVSTVDTSDKLTNIFGGDLAAVDEKGPVTATGSGDDIDSLVDKINKLPDTCGVVAANDNGKLLIKSIAEGENAILNITNPSDNTIKATDILGLSPIEYHGSDNITVYKGSSDYSGTFADNTTPSGVAFGTTETKTTISLVGTRIDGTLGDQVDIEIVAAGPAIINAGENYTISPETKLLQYFNTLKEFDKLVFTVKNPYNPDQNEEFEIGINENLTFEQLKQAITDNSEYVEMYFTQNGLETAYSNLDNSGDEGFGFRTKNGIFGPKVSLSVTVKDMLGNTKTVFNGNNSDFLAGIAETKGSGDDLDSIINKINDKTAVSGVSATKDSNNKLVLRTVNISDDATLRIFGDAANYFNFYSIDTNNNDTEGNYTEPLKLLNVPISSININGSGIITGTDSKGSIIEWDSKRVSADNKDNTYPDIAQIILYNFANQNGLKRAANNMFERSDASGSENPGKPGEAGYGTVESGSLEMSNVDMTDEFSSMITTQRGYQANARMVTVSDTMLEELLNLKR